METTELKSLLDKMGLRRVTQRNNNLMACCPFHKENNPSWGISVSEPHFYGCFGCGAKGTLFTLLIKIGGYSASKSAQLTNRIETEFNLPTFGDARKGINTIDYRLLYPFQLTKTAIQYLRKRGVDLVTAEKTELTFDHVQERVLFPWKYMGLLIGVTGRSIDPDNRVKTLPYFGTMKGQCPYFPSGSIDIKSPLVIVEGEIDALRVYQAGFPNVCAVGFGRLSKDQAALILASGVREIIVFTDDDHTGDLIAHQIAKLLGERLRVHRVSYRHFRRTYADQLGEDDKLDPAFLEERDIVLALKHNVRKDMSWPKF